MRTIGGGIRRNLGRLSSLRCPLCPEFHATNRLRACHHRHRISNEAFYRCFCRRHGRHSVPRYLRLGESKGRCEYTVIGNTVNIAARLEGLNRTLHTRLLVTSDFYAALPEYFVKYESKGKHNIRGIPQAIELVELTELV